MNPMKVAVMGDICLEAVTESMTPAMAQGILFEVQPLLQGADIRIANLENAIPAEDTPIRKCGPRLKQTRQALCFVKEANIDCCTLANNHVGDYGPNEVLHTMQVLDEEGIGHCGAGADRVSSYRIWYKTTSAGTLAVLSITENDYGCASAHTAGVAGYDVRLSMRAIREARERADFVLVIMHGGNEYNPLPSPGARERYRAFVDLGADAVVGMHPHCIQGMEYYAGAPIVYSPGNFFFPDTEEDPSWWTGYMVELSFAKDRKPEAVLHPYRVHPERNTIHIFTGEERQIMLDYIERLSSIIREEDGLMDYFEGWCMIKGPAHAGYVYDNIYVEKPDTPLQFAPKALYHIRRMEAHHELVTQLYRVIMEGRVKEAQAMVPKLRALQKMPL